MICFMAIAVAVGVAVGWMGAEFAARHRVGPDGPQKVLSLKVERDTIKVSDTIVVDEPRLLSRREKAMVVERLPVDGCRAAAADSVDVAVDYEQKEFGDSTFRAWVTGHNVEVDSFRLIVPTTTVIERSEVVVEAKETPRRWSVGLTGGIGLTPRGVQPYVGVGVSLRLF